MLYNAACVHARLGNLTRSESFLFRALKAGYTDLSELRPGVKGIINANNEYDENGWETMGLPSEASTDGGSYEEMKEKAGL